MSGRVNLDPRLLRASTRVFSLAYPFLPEAGLPVGAVFMGTEVIGGGAFCADPWDWYRQEIVTGASIVLIGALGTGKSTCAKTFATRLVLSGKHVAVASDAKGEWGRVARWLGGKVIAVGPGRNDARLNPLDEGVRPSTNAMGAPLSDDEWLSMVRARRMSVMIAIAETLLASRPLYPVEHTALSRGLDAVVAVDATPTVRLLVEQMRNPSPAVAAELGGEAKDIVHALGRMLEGDLGGMFDGESTVTFDPHEPMMVVDTSALRGAPEAARKITNICTSAWVEAAITNRDNGQWLIVYEEGWDTMSDPALLARMVEQWKIAREFGIVNMLIMHKIADLNMAGDEGSRTRALADSLLTDAQIRIVYRQEADAIESTQKALGLSDTEAATVAALPRGVGLWRVGNRSFIVRNQMSRAEVPAFDTSSRMEA